MNVTLRTSTFLAGLALSGLLLAPGCIIVDDDDSSLTVDNQSRFVIEDLRVAQTDDPSWGPNLIPDALFPDEQVTISLDCDVYDAQLIDESGVTCTLDGIDLCFDDAIWVITNNTCDVWQAAQVLRDSVEMAKKAASENAQQN